MMRWRFPLIIALFIAVGIAYWWHDRAVLTPVSTVGAEPGVVSPTAPMEAISPTHNI